MTNTALSKALLQQNQSDAGATSQTHQQVVLQIMERRKRRLRLLGGVTLFSWLLAVGIIFLIYWLFLAFAAPRLAEAVWQPGQAMDQSPEFQQGLREEYAGIIRWGNRLVGISVFFLVLAVSGTILLVFASRRVTLGQMSAELASISEQLKELQQSLQATSPHRVSRTEGGLNRDT